MEYQRYIRNRQIERAKKLLKNLEPETYKKGPHDVTRFIKRTSSARSGEKVTDRYEIDQNVIEEEKYDGFYAVATNLDDSAKDILEASTNRYKIEDMCYMSTYTSSEVCTALNAVMELGLDKKYYQPKELNKKIKKLSR